LSVKSQGKSCRSWLAGDAGNSVFQTHRGDAIAGKPAPTVEPCQPLISLLLLTLKPACRPLCS
ncbi:hypothetical protein QN410_34095, partial [Pseudomonas sp. Bout1]|nr:hypothetical protein [Pseudomonas sp. Bout1]